MFNFIQRRWRARQQQHAAAFARERFGCRRADAARCAGDQAERAVINSQVNGLV